MKLEDKKLNLLGNFKIVYDKNSVVLNSISFISPTMEIIVRGSFKCVNERITYHVHAVLEGNNWAVVGKQPVSPSPKNTDTQAYYHPELQGPSREEDTDRLCHLNCRALLGLAS